MPKLPLTLYPAKSLQTPSAKIDDISVAQELCSDMVETMEAEKGVGLAAPQVGRNIRLAVINKDTDKSLDEHLVIINPKIFSASREMDEDTEGCLSIPGVEVPVSRHRKIKVRYTDLNGQEQKIKAVNLFARVLQHEIDHLDGVLILDRSAQK